MLRSMKRILQVKKLLGVGFEKYKVYKNTGYYKKYFIKSKLNDNYI